MPFLRGVISDKIRAIFPAGDPAYSPPADRNDSPSRGQATPKSSAITALSKADRKKPKSK